MADNIAHTLTELEGLRAHPDLEFCGLARTPAALFEEARALEPEVILLNARLSGIDAVATVPELLSVSPASKVLILSESDDPEIHARAQRVGAMGVISLSLDGDAVAAAILKAAGRGSADLDGSDGQSGLSQLGGDASTPIQEVIPRRRRVGQKSEIFVVFSGKGGVGCSVIASNLAIAIATRTAARVALVDLDLQFGDLRMTLASRHPHTIEGLIEHGEMVDAEILDTIMAHGPADVRILTAPNSPEVAELITTPLLRTIVRELQKSFDYIVVDTSSHLEELSIDVLESADHILNVTSHNIASVRAAKVTLELLQSLGIDKEKISLVLNQLGAKAAISREDIEQTLRHKILAHVPYDPKQVDAATDAGEAFILSDPKTPVSAAIFSIVDYLVPPELQVASPSDGSRSGGKSGRRRFSLGRK